MTLLFMLEERIHNKAEIPLLRCYNIRQLFVATLPKLNLDFDEVVSQMEKRHKKRADATRSAAKLKDASGRAFANG